MSDSDDLDLIAELPHSEGYTPQDRYRDFRAVFMSTEQGQRVLREILAWGHVFKPSVQAAGAIDPHRVTFAEGERNIALRLLTTINREPVDGPKQANRNKEQ